MPIANEQPLRFIPRGTCDTVDGDNSPAGACMALQNLIFTPSTPGVLECRPAADLISEFDDAMFTDPTEVTVAYEVNGIIYGMVTTQTTPGYDQPFAYNPVNDTFTTVSGTQDATTLPATQATSGAWTPPTMDMMGIYLIVTHPGFPGGGGAFFGWFDLSNPAAPAWHAGNTVTTVLPGVPKAVRQFNNRAYFAVDNAAWYTNALTLTISAATQVLVIGDKSPLNALIGLPFGTTSQAILQGLLAFKEGSISQITGDAAFSNLALNDLSLEVGTDAPRSLASTPDGVYFKAIDGMRKVTFTGQLTNPNSDLTTPFISVLHPSRCSGAYNNNIYRICLQNTAALDSPFQEYWYDLKRAAWTGPHTFRQDMAVAYKSQFIAFNNDEAPGVFTSQVVQDAFSIFEELDEQLQWVYQTAPMTDVHNMYANSAIVSTVEMALPATGDTYLILGSDESGGFLSNGSITGPLSVAIWNDFDWGDGTLWGAVQYGLRPYIIPWTKTLVFSKLVAQVSGPSAAGLKIGGMYFGYIRLKYLLP